MIKFEEHDGKIFLMLDKPTPLTPDAEMPCLVRLIQDDSPMGKHNKDLHGYDPEGLTPKICTEVIDVNDLSDPKRGSVRYDGYISGQYYHFEIIGTLVTEGSAEWAWQMLKLQKPVSHPAEGELQDTDYTKEGFVRCMAKTGWQLYEPKPEPFASVKKGDLIMCSDGVERKVLFVSNIEDIRSNKLWFNLRIDNSPLYNIRTFYFNGTLQQTENPLPFTLCYICAPKQNKPAFKVGDWVVIERKGKTYHYQVILFDDDGLARVEFSSSKMKIADIGETSLLGFKTIRKLHPSEVVIHIGCLSGTVKDLSYVEDGRFWFIGKKTERCPGGMHAILYDEMLDPKTNELVKSLLRAQEESND